MTSASSSTKYSNSSSPSSVIDRDALEVAGVQPVVAGDVDLLEDERDRGAHALEHGARVVAEVAARPAVEHDAPHRTLKAGESRTDARFWRGACARARKR